MKIVVTGSEGVLMQSVIPKLLLAGHTVLGIDNLYRHGEASKSANVDYEFAQQDLIDSKYVTELLVGADFVIHAAAKIYGVLGLVHYRADILGDDVAICRNVMQACVTNDVKRVAYISSSMVYDSCVQQVGIDLEESMTDRAPMPRTDYGLSKLVCERMVKAYKAQYDIDYTIWRPFNIVNPYEPSMKEQGFSHVLPDFINNIVYKNKNPLPIIGDGEQIRCFTWLDDVSDIIAKYSMSKKSKNNVYNICNAEPTTMKQVAKIIYQAIGNDPDNLLFDSVGDYEHDVKVRIPSVDKLQNDFGPINFVSTEESIKRCLQAIQ